MPKYTDIHTREKIVRLYTEEHMRTREIAVRLKVSPSTVHYWINRYVGYIPEEGEEEVTIENDENSTGRKSIFENKKKLGRPRSTNTETDRRILDMSTANPFEPCTDIRLRLNLNVHPQTIRNRLKQFGLVNRVPAKKEYLKPHHRQKRLQFALNHRDWTVEDWSRIIFSDEKVFYSGGHGPLRVWRKVGMRFHENYISVKQRSARFSIPVWACICNATDPSTDISDSESNVSLFNAIHRITDRTLTARYYVDNILQPIISPLSENQQNLSYMHDLSPIHTSRLTTTWLRQNQIPFMEDWPPKGADINPIENLWAEIERRLSKRTPANANDCWEMVRDTFYAITSPNDGYIDSLIRSMPTRMHDVIAAEGGWTKY